MLHCVSCHHCQLTLLPGNAALCQLSSLSVDSLTRECCTVSAVIIVSGLFYKGMLNGVSCHHCQWTLLPGNAERCQLSPLSMDTRNHGMLDCVLIISFLFLYTSGINFSLYGIDFSFHMVTICDSRALYVDDLETSLDSELTYFRNSHV